MKAHRKAFLTGGSKGIGAAIRKKLQEDGVEVISPTRRELDLSRPSAVQAYLKSLDQVEVDILINNAGINLPTALAKISSLDWDQTFHVNLQSAFLLTQFFAPHMAKKGHGRILNISSILGFSAKQGRVLYSMTKAALDALTRAASVEYASCGVLTNSLAPGYVATGLTHANNTSEQLADIQKSIPVGRLGQPEEIAEIASFLVSEKNTLITGQVIVADGGLTACRF